MRMIDKLDNIEIQVVGKCYDEYVDGYIMLDTKIWIDLVTFHNMITTKNKDVLKGFLYSQGYNRFDDILIILSDEERYNYLHQLSLYRGIGNTNADLEELGFNNSNEIIEYIAKFDTKSFNNKLETLV